MQETSVIFFAKISLKLTLSFNRKYVSFLVFSKIVLINYFYSNIIHFLAGWKKALILLIIEKGNGLEICFTHLTNCNIHFFAQIIRDLIKELN